MIIALAIYTYCVISWTATFVVIYDETHMIRVEKLFWCVASPFYVWLMAIATIWEWLTEKPS